MWPFNLRRPKVYRPHLLLQQLEERIVLDAAVNPAPQDNPVANTDSVKDAAAQAAPATDNALAGSAGVQPPPLPTTYDHVLSHDLNVVLISNALGDVEAISEAAAPDAKVIVFDAQHDNLSTIGAKLHDLAVAEGKTISTLALVSHTEKGVLEFGIDKISLFTLNDYRDSFEFLSGSSV